MLKHFICKYPTNKCRYSFY